MKMVESLMSSAVHYTLGDLSRYAAYVCEQGDADTSWRCFQMLRGMNDHVQQMYYTNVLQLSLRHVLHKERLATAYVTTATCMVVWAVAILHHLRPTAPEV